MDFREVRLNVAEVNMLRWEPAITFFVQELSEERGPVSNFLNLRCVDGEFLLHTLCYGLRVDHAIDVAF